jgi:antitoxin component HigA of HigAB toxin-antitoxin module
VQLGELVGGRAQASLILNGKRELSKANIRALSDHFGLDAGYFL